MSALDDVLAALVKYPELGAWGTPADYSVVVRQDQPVDSGTSQYKVETVAMAEDTVLVRRTGAEIEARAFASFVSDLGVLLADGTVAMSGDLDMGGNDLISAGSYNGINVGAHSTRHGAVGADPVNHDGLSGFVADEHIDHSGVYITAGNGLSGGGNLTATRTIDLDLNDLTFGTPVLATDSIAYYDDALGDTRRVVMASAPYYSAVGNQWVGLSDVGTPDDADRILIEASPTFSKGYITADVFQLRDSDLTEIAGIAGSTGTIIVRNNAGTWVSLAVSGVDGRVLTEDSADAKGISWQAGGGGSSYSTTFDNGDLSSGVLTVSHSLDSQYSVVQVWDNNDNIIVPDDAASNDPDSCDIDLSSYGTLTGIWKVTVIGA